jgi:glutamine synthetase
MVEGLEPTPATEGSAYGQDFGLHKHIYSAVEALQESESMRDMLGDSFVDLYTALKDAEYQEFQEIITPWEREILMFNV